MNRLVCGLSLFCAAGSLFAQSPSPSGSPLTPEEAAAAAAAAAGIFGVWGACCVFQFLLIIGSIAAWIFTGIWVMNDAKARNSENAQLVTILGWLVWPVGLIVHLTTRPKGNLVPCPNCQKKRLEGLAICPHCGQP
jgi:membrane associated rhomboid family serine protease